MSYKNNEDKFSARYGKCAGFGFCACCEESVCTEKSTETFDDFINDKIKNIQSRNDKTTYTKDEVIQLLKS
jgi:hypothetical protein